MQIKVRIFNHKFINNKKIFLFLNFSVFIISLIKINLMNLFLKKINFFFLLIKILLEIKII
jgi:hypothetical protein